MAHTFSPPMTANGGKRDFTCSLIAGFTDWCEEHGASKGGLLNSMEVSCIRDLGWDQVQEYLQRHADLALP